MVLPDNTAMGDGDYVDSEGEDSCIFRGWWEWWWITITEVIRFVLCMWFPNITYDVQILFPATGLTYWIDGAMCPVLTSKQFFIELQFISGDLLCAAIILLIMWSVSTTSRISTWRWLRSFIPIIVVYLVSFWFYFYAECSYKVLQRKPCAGLTQTKRDQCKWWLY